MDKEAEKEKRKEYHKQYRLLHGDEIREKDRKRNLKRKEYKASNNREWREKHQLELKNKKKAYYDAHKKEISRQHKEYYDKRKTEFREKRVSYLFGIDADTYNGMVERQKNLCAICGKPESTTRNGITKRLAIDHNHTTGKIRELLCHNCNTAIGKAKEDITILEKMIAYLRKHNE